MNIADKKRSLAVDVYVLVFGQLPPRKIAPLGYGLGLGQGQG